MELDGVVQVRGYGVRVLKRTEKTRIAVRVGLNDSAGTILAYRDMVVRAAVVSGPAGGGGGGGGEVKRRRDAQLRLELIDEEALDAMSDEDVAEIFAAAETGLSEAQQGNS